MNGHHGLYYKGNATIPQNFYDESIRVPCVWRMPGKSAAGQVNRSWVNHCDQFETILDLASVIRKRDVESNPGTSLLPMLLGKATETRPIAICDAQAVKVLLVWTFFIGVEVKMLAIVAEFGL